MAAAAELRGDFVHVHLVAFGAQADARQFGFDFLKDAGDDDRLDGADVVNESFRVVAFRAGAGEIGRLSQNQAIWRSCGQAEPAVNMFEQPRARERIRLINLVANFGEVRAARDEFRAGVKRAGPRRGILKRAGVGGNGGEQAVGNRLGDRPARDFEHAVNQFAAGRLARGNPVDVGVARVAFVMVNVDENFPVADALATLPSRSKARAIGGDDAVEFCRVSVFETGRRVEEFVFLRDGIFVPANNFFAFVLQRQREAELRADAIAVGPDMADDAKGFAVRG
jgi:hypothetical protein